MVFIGGGWGGDYGSGYGGGPVRGSGGYSQRSQGPYGGKIFCHCETGSVSTK